MSNGKNNIQPSIFRINEENRIAAYLHAEDGSSANLLHDKAVSESDAIWNLVNAAVGIIKSNNKLFKEGVRKCKFHKLVNKETMEYRENKTFAPTKPVDLFLYETELGYLLTKVLYSLTGPVLIEHLSDLELSVEITTFLRVVNESGILEALWRGREPKKVELKEKVRILNEFVDQFRLAAKSKEFKQAVNSSNRRVNKNSRSVEKYLDSVFESYSRILFIRLDLGYRKPKSMGYGEFARHITEERARNDLEVFLDKNAPHGLFKNLIGYVVRMEVGPHKGLHFHAMMLFDGRHHREDITIATALGHYWVEITNEDGLFFNCNQKWSGMPHCAIGMIHRNDTDKRKELNERVVKYLTKMDRYFQFLPKLTGRTLFRSQIRGSSTLMQTITSQKAEAVE